MVSIKKNNFSGFTLMELIVVIAILGILATVAISALNPLEQLKKARDSRRRTDLKNLQTAMETYKVKIGSYPSSFSVLDSSGSYGTRPKDPLGGDYPTSFDTANNAAYCICALIERGNGDYYIPTGTAGACASSGLGDRDYICVTQLQ